MNTKELIQFLENKEFNVSIISEPDNTLAAEIEAWTKRGVSMIMYVSPFSIESFQEYAESFDIDEEVDIHREDKNYKKFFTLRQSLEDFEDFKNTLVKVSGELSLK